MDGNDLPSYLISCFYDLCLIACALQFLELSVNLVGYFLELLF